MRMMKHMEKRKNLLPFKAFLSVFSLVIFVAFLSLQTKSAIAVTVPADSISAAITRSIENSPARTGMESVVTVPHVTDVEVKDISAPVIQVVLPLRERRGTSIPVRVLIGNGKGEPAKRLNFVAQVKTFATVAVAAHDVPRGDSLSNADVEMKKMEVRGIGGYYLSPASLSGVSTKMTIKAGSIILSRNLQSAPLVHRGDKVTITAQVGQLEIKADGTARQDGGRGEYIRVYNTITKTSKICKIIDSRTVEVGKEGVVK
jgi:flagella basal body P-ring formation protein FlgA